MLALDGMSLLGDNEYAEAYSFVNKYIDLNSFVPWLNRLPSQQGLSMLTDQIGAYPYKKPKIGQFYWPTGMSRWGYGNFLCDSDTTQTILADSVNPDGSYNLLPFQIGNPENNNPSPSQNPDTTQQTIFPRELISTQVFLLPPTPLSGIRGLTVQDNGVASLYLLTVVDPRYFYWQQNVGNIEIDQDTTWQDLIDMLMATILKNATPAIYPYANIPNYPDPPSYQGPMYQVDTISPSYLGPSVQMFTLPYEPIPPIMDAIANNIGMRIAANYDGSFSFQLQPTALDVLNNDMVDQSTGNPKPRFPVAGGQRFSSPL